MQQPLPGHKAMRFVIAGGGTGGHVFPAIAIARAIRSKHPNARILFVGARGRMEMHQVPAAGFHILGLRIEGIHRRLTWKNLLVPFKLIDSMIRAKNIVRRFRPDVVIGVGGYASGPVVRAAAKRGIPTLIQEQNSYPGITNRLLASRASKICVAYEGMQRFFPREKLYLTGNPVRKDITMLQGKKEAALAYFGLASGKPVLLVTGGSLGARTINESLMAHLGLLVSQGVQVIWQSGRHYEAAARRIKENIEATGVHIAAFIERMDYAYAAADVVVSRAGAIAVSELCAVQKPAILIPSPNVAEDHQTKNAMALVNHHAAVMIRDGEAGEKLIPAVLELIHDENKKHRLRERMAGLGIRDAADTIAGMAIGLVKQPGTESLKDKNR